MIKLVTLSGFNHTLEPTIFPDGTTQVWKLPEEILQSNIVGVDWRFESEREIIDLLSLRKLLKNQNISLHVPYLPYGRQDKNISNTSTFNLEVFADLINSMNFTVVSTVDVHNPYRTAQLIKNFQNIPATKIHEYYISGRGGLGKYYSHVVFPDAGAADRYSNRLDIVANVVICDKTRDQLTGAIVGHKVIHQGGPVKLNDHLLIIDDICDGGATFISIAKTIHAVELGAIIDLFVTHGIFSRGVQHLWTNGISNVYTTNSLIKNIEGYKV